MKLILLGPPGSGKGTVSEKLEHDFKFRHISAGELLRKQVRQKTAIGKLVKPIMERGDLVPDDITIGLIKKAVAGKKHYLLDGFPRTLYQANKIEDLKIDLVLYLVVHEKVVVKRLAGRRVCEKGIHNYHLTFLPPKIKGLCDLDGSTLMQRKDDHPTAIKERFRVYHRQTEPVVRFYRKKGILKKVNAALLPEEVYVAVKRLLSS